MFNFQVSSLLRLLDQRQVFRIINQARPQSSYLFAQYLPERQLPTFEVKSGNIRVLPTMAGLAAWDSPYPEGGMVLTSTIAADVAKQAISVALNEQDKRTMYEMMLRMGQGSKSSQYFVTTLLNFSDKILKQSVHDRREWLRGRALIDHQIDWTFNKKNCKVDYQIPSIFRLAARSGNDGYGGNTSKFWTDITTAKRLLKHRVAAIIAHPDTWEMIYSNSYNKARILNLNEETGDVELVRIVGTMETNDTDPRYRMKGISYGLEGAVYDPEDPEKVIYVPFMDRGKILVLGRGGPRGLNIGADSVDQGPTPDEVKPFGYHHIAPTDEGGYAMGDWGRIYTPEGEPNKIIGQAVSNNLPVLEAQDQAVVLTTDMV